MKARIKDESALSWKSIIPAAPGWFAVDVDPMWLADKGDRPNDGFNLDRIIAWAWVHVEEHDYNYDALWGIVAEAPPDFEGPPGLVIQDARYIHESDITPEMQTLWRDKALALKEHETRAETE